MSGSTQCPHSDLHFEINNQGFHDTNLHYLEIRAKCNTCGKPMCFRGLPLGLSPHRPTGELGGYEVRLPFVGEGEELQNEPPGFIGKVVK